MKFTKNLYIIGFLMLLIACQPSTPEIKEKGTLEGTIHIGPICPVERIPPDPQCKPSPETFAAWPISIYTPDNKKTATVVPDADGHFVLQLPAGTYIIDLEKHQPIGGNNLPATIKISSGKTTTFDVDIDTGIR